MIQLARNTFVIIVITLFSSLMLFLSFSDNLLIRNERQSYNLSTDSITDDSKEKTSPRQQPNVSFDDIINGKERFNMVEQDLLVLLHIQKTGGTTFERHLVQDLMIDMPCLCNNERRRCSCLRPNRDRKDKLQTIAGSTWLISRFSTGWICGLHADWTDLDSCLKGLNRIFLMTFMRHPLHRFVSEFRHVQRGATWKASHKHCERYDTQACYRKRENWYNVSLEEFLSCPSNGAINRQTRMLANHKIVGCPVDEGKTASSKDGALLENAMKNLNELAFIGICEEQRISQLIFEKTFNLKFRNKFSQSEDNKTQSLIAELPENTKEKIISLNHLDMKLYKYATELFERRRQLLSVLL